MHEKKDRENEFRLAFRSCESHLEELHSPIASEPLCEWWVMRSILSATALFASVGLLFAAPVPKPEKKDTEKLVGVWKLTQSDALAAAKYTFTIEFTEKGKLIARYQFAETTQTLEGKYKIDGEKIEYTLGDRGETLTIEKLTDDDLVVIDPEKKKEEFVRVKEKKKE